MSYKDAAKFWGVSHNTAKNYLSYKSEQKPTITQVQDLAKHVKETSKYEFQFKLGKEHKQ